MKFYKQKTDKGIYYIAIGNSGSLITNCNGKVWHPHHSQTKINSENTEEINKNLLPAILQKTIDEFIF